MRRLRDVLAHLHFATPREAFAKMIKPSIGTSTRVVGLILAVTNVMSFALGISIAGRYAVARIENAGANRTKPIAASGIAALYGRNKATLQRPIPIAGKGMWIWQFDKIARGNRNVIVREALRAGLTHIFVRLGSSVDGPAGLRNIARILPVAHAAGLKVIAWDFPYMYDVSRDLRRASFVLRGSFAGGNTVDGFAADIETRSEGTNLQRPVARAYAAGLRRIAKGDSFLILVPPRPNSYTIGFYPYDSLIPYFDAVAPMVYWGSEHPTVATANAIDYLRRFGKPIAPIGQAFDMGPEGGPKGAPPSVALIRFMQEADLHSAVGVSFWSWQHTPSRLWRTINSFRWQPSKAS